MNKQPKSIMPSVTAIPGREALKISMNLVAQVNGSQ